MQKNYYLILGITADANLDEIKAAFRRRARELHPDHSGLESGPFLEAQEAYGVLSDPARRRDYDRRGEAIARRRPWGPSAEPLVRERPRGESFAARGFREGSLDRRHRPPQRARRLRQGSSVLWFGCYRGRRICSTFAFTASSILINGGQGA